MGTEITSAAQQKMDFMSMLITELKNQNPLEPMDNTEMATQMAQLSQLQQMEDLNTTFSKVAASQQLSEASGLLGKKVTYLDSQSQTQQGTVSQVTLSSGTINLLVGNSQVSLDNIVSVQNT
jgi:flagellar basal-body rod modification protein FlgD